VKKLLVGIQTLSEGNFAYVDKTKYAFELINNYEYVFFSSTLFG